MNEVPLALAAAAGALAVVNPCGFALLPVYASLLVVGEPPGRLTAVWRALGFSAAIIAGFVAVFGAFGLLVAPLAGAAQQHLPWVTIALGVLLMAAGGWLLAGRSLPFPALHLGQGRPVSRTFPSMALFGAGYALASLSCTVGPFLAIVVSSFSTGSAAAGLGLFAAYGVGMALVVGAVSLAVALARMSLAQWLRRTGRLVSRLAGGLLVVVGGYVAYYGWYEIRSRRAIVDDPVITVAATIQRWLAGFLDRLGVTGVFAAFAALLLVGLAVGWFRRRARPSS
ncbi:MAG: cytochrome c biogenesis protein CcdA [Streptosporangiales bacterium]|nr:cytochrome c biogenesis protein CcdA [Streptosporangiales bacterium]